MGECVVDTQDSLKSNCDRFVLEEAIVACFNVADDLTLIIEEVLAGNADPDELATMLTGVAGVHKLRCSKALDVFSNMVDNGAVT